MTATHATPSMQVDIRYFAAARAAVGVESETVAVPPGTTLAGLVDALSGRDSVLARVLSRCSFLCDGIAVRDRDVALTTGQTVDVLPPFAGG
jgi:molybdopterin converting factor small subunit